MTSSNIQKIVQNNFHLNPWVLSKNTNEIVNTCIQKIYKQVPQNFKKDLKQAKVATQRPENKGPIRTFQSQVCDRQPSKIRPQLPLYPAKKSSRSKAHQNHLVDILNASNKNNSQIRNKTTSTAVAAVSGKKLLKSPNFKIYGSRRFGSSASSSRSSLFRRYDERRRQRHQYPQQLNYLVRSIHSGQFDATFAKYLKPTRNQQLKGDLGSVPDAMRVSSTIQNDLMFLDAAIRNRISVKGDTTKRKHKMQPDSEDNNCLKSWEHPPPLSNFQGTILSQLLAKPKSKATKPAVLSREHRDYGRYAAGPVVPIRHTPPPNEVFTAEHDRQNTELHEKHRRNRMRKLGLVKDSPNYSAIDQSSNNEKSNPNTETIGSHRNHREQQQVPDSDSCCYSKSSPLMTQLESRRKSAAFSRSKRPVSYFPTVKNNHASLEEDSPEEFSNILTKLTKGKTSKSTKASDNVGGGGETSLSSTSTIESTSDSKRLDGPLAMAASQLSSTIAGNSPAYSGYRYNRANFFPSKRY